MMDIQLNSWLMFAHAGTHNRHSEIITRTADGQTVRHQYGDFARRSQQLMHALDGLGLDPGDRVATLAWNSFRHLEAYFAVPCTGLVLHTANVRLSSEDLRYILHHARDRVVLVDPDLLGVLEPIRKDLPHLEHVIVLGDEVPDTSIEGLVAYEPWIAKQPERYQPIEIDEHSPMGICYTSGTTGRPKAVEYTHRSTFLHSMAASSPSAMRIGRSDSVLPMVPMFHANAWGLAHAAVMAGAKLVFYAGALEPGELIDLLVDEGVTVSAGVPTVWHTVAEELTRRGQRLPQLSHIGVGGSQPARNLISQYRTEFGVDIVQAWGMTETSPLAAMAWPQHRLLGSSDDELLDRVASQAGLPLPGVEITIRLEDGSDAPFDGETMGDLHIRGPWVADQYLYGEGSDSFTDDGWFNTGDVAVGSPDGYFVIADRTKDLIKSGGEWISSVDMEGAIMAMGKVAEAAVVAVPDPKWQERPMAFVVSRVGQPVTLDEIQGHLLESGFAKWQLPQQIEEVPEIPKTAVGKYDKKLLRAGLT